MPQTKELSDFTVSADDLALYESAKDRDDTARMITNLVRDLAERLTTRWTQGDLDTARQALHKVLEIHRRSGADDTESREQADAALAEAIGLRFKSEAARRAARKGLGFKNWQGAWTR